MGEIINQVAGHGGARPGAGRPAGARDRAAVERDQVIAQVVERVELGDLLKLGPGDVLRLAMLLQLRAGDLDGAADFARRLLPIWQPAMANEDCAHVFGPGMAIVNRLVRELHEADAASVVSPLGVAARPAGRR